MNEKKQLIKTIYSILNEKNIDKKINKIKRYNINYETILYYNENIY